MRAATTTARGTTTTRRPANLFRLFDAGHKERLFKNIAAAMAGVPEEIVRCQIAHFSKVDPEYGAGVAKSLGLNLR